MEEKQNYIFGMHPIMEAVRTGKNIDKVMIKQGIDSPQFRELMELLKEKNVSAQFVPVERLNRVCKGNHQGIIALFSKIEYTPFEEMVDMALMQSDAPIFVMLDGVSDVRNLGAIARTAECAGASGIIVPAKGGAAITSEGIKASAGALLRVSVAKTQNLRLPALYLKQQGFQIVGATEKSEKSLYQVDFTKPTAIVMGSEGKGISDSMLALCDEKAKIPMAGEIGSLNVSVATAITLYEAVRQRGGNV